MNLLPRSVTPLKMLALATLLTSQHAMAALWLDQAGKYTPVADEAVKLLLNAQSEGLNPADYRAAHWQQAIRAGMAGDEQTDAQFTQSMEKYFKELHDGRIDPRQIREHYDGPRAPFDATATLQQAVAGGSMKPAVASATPASPQYAALRDYLHKFQTLQQSPAWSSALPAVPKGAGIKAGQSWAGAAQLAKRLSDLGDMPASPPAGDPAAYTAAIQNGVKSFQERHGLAANGVLNQATLNQLNVPLDTRAAQVALAMERMRWTPLEQGKRVIVVNVPEFTLYGYEVGDRQIQQKLTMRVIVGKALDTRTPLFDEDMRFIEFSPYWNVPPSIARKELLPKIHRDPGYLARNNFEIVGSGGVQGVASGTARIRQKPGGRNALGDIKFVFPNNENIYLHHTSSPGLFSRTKRDFSHGCIRVEEPVNLAKFVLQDEPSWTEQRIRQAMDSGKSQTLRLKQPIPVLITYSTTVVRNGKLVYLPDLYQHDAALSQALKQRK